MINDRLRVAYVGVTSQRIDKRFSQHRRIQNPCRSREIANLPETEFRQLTDYIYTAENVQQSLEQKYCESFEKKGFRILNKETSLGGVGYSERKLTKELCEEEALKFSSRWEFQQSSVNAYAAAKRHGWIDDVCQHMVPSKNGPDFWTKEECKKEARKYGIRTEFRDRSPYTYKVASQNGWLDDVLSELEVIKLEMWEKANADASIWKNADHYFAVWSKNPAFTGYQLSKRVGIAGHKLNSMVKSFRDGWIPLADEKWREWAQ